MLFEAEYLNESKWFYCEGYEDAPWDLPSTLETKETGPLLSLYPIVGGSEYDGGMITNFGTKLLLWNELTELNITWDDLEREADGDIDNLSGRKFNIYFMYHGFETPPS